MPGSFTVDKQTNRSATTRLILSSHDGQDPILSHLLPPSDDPKKNMVERSEGGRGSSPVHHGGRPGARRRAARRAARHAARRTARHAARRAARHAARHATRHSPRLALTRRLGAGSDREGAGLPLERQAAAPRGPEIQATGLGTRAANEEVRQAVEPPAAENNPVVQAAGWGRQQQEVPQLAQPNRHEIQATGWGTPLSNEEVRRLGLDRVGHQGPPPQPRRWGQPAIYPSGCSYPNLRN